jgi:HEAT repeat protein
MTALPLALLLALAAPGAAARGRPAPPASGAEAATTPAAPLSDEEMAARVQTYLSTIDTPISAERWRELGPRAVAPLEAVLGDPDALPRRRARAVDALSIVGGNRARELVLATARSEELPYGIRASALRGAGRLLGSQELVAQLRPVMESAGMAPVRSTAAEVLARNGGSAGCSAVRAQAGRERGQDRRQFTRALETCGVTP